MDPIPSDVFEKLPKVLWDNSRVGYTAKLFYVAIKNGSNILVQALTPEHMKEIAQMFAYNVKDYEGKHGEIKASWDPNTKSPIQITSPDKGGGTSPTK